MKNVKPKTIAYALLFSASVSLTSTAYADVKDEAKETYHESKEALREAHEGTHDGYHSMKEKAEEKTEQAWEKTKDTTQKAWSSTKEAFNEGLLAGKLETAIMLNEHLNPFDIDIDINGSTARLSGKVDSEVEKDLAEAIADGIDGIDEVENRLVISRDARQRSNEATEKNERREFSQYIEDVSTTAAIKAELLANDNIKGMDINVDTFKDEVTLTGTVQRDSQKSLAETIVKKREGVVRIVNNLKVSS